MKIAYVYTIDEHHEFRGYDKSVITDGCIFFIWETKETLMLPIARIKSVTEIESDE